MMPLAWYAIAALTIVLGIFYFVRRIPAYLALTVVVVAGFAAVTAGRVDWTQGAEWVVIVVGLLLCIFGLLIVRVMLIRSVSLQLLARIDGGGQESIGEDIGRRLHDMRSFRLIRTAPDGTSALTGWGRLVGAVVAVFYAVFRIET
jgi:hypothetical protein